MSRTVSPNVELPSAVICDVDGTLCDVRPIRYLVERSNGGPDLKPNFERFHSASIDCAAYPAVVRVLERARSAGFAILVVTGREEKWSFLTSKWLREKGIAYDELLMRPAKDYRPDTTIKAEIAKKLSKRYTARFALDDRRSLMEVWKSAGIPSAIVADHGQIGPIEWPLGSEPDPLILNLTDRRAGL